MSETATRTAAATLACASCGAMAWQPVRVAWAVHQCGRCRHVAAQNPYAASSTDPLYGEEFARQQEHPTYSFVNGCPKLRDERLWRQRLEPLAALRQSGRLLDVGCAVVALLDFARSLGWTPQGVESSAWEVRYAREHFGLQVHEGILEPGVFADQSFDVVLCSHTLEHVPEPDKLADQFFRVLRPGGAALIVVPTQFTSLTYRLFSRPVGEPPPRHVQFFSRASLTRMLRARGFTVERASMNLQVAYLANAIGRRKLGSAMERKSSDLHRTERAQTSTQIARMGKAAINWAASIGDFGDELTVLARKP